MEKGFTKWLKVLITFRLNRKLKNEEIKIPIKRENGKEYFLIPLGVDNITYIDIVNEEQETYNSSFLRYHFNGRAEVFYKIVDPVTNETIFKPKKEPYTKRIRVSGVFIMLSDPEFYDDNIRMKLTLLIEDLV